MHPRLKSLSLFTTILLLALTPLLVPNVVGAHGRAPLRIATEQASTAANGTEVDKLFQEGVQQYRRGEYPKAITTYQRVLEIRQQLNDQAGIAQTLNNLGEVYNLLREPDKALEILQQALAIRRELKDRKGVGETLDNLGFAYFLNTQNDKALESLQQALAISRELQDKSGESKTLSNLGLLYGVGLKQYPKALETLQQALAIHQQLGDKFLTGITLGRIGRVYESMKEYTRALEWYEKSLVVNREVQNRAGEGESLIAVGDAYYYLEKYDRFLEFYQQALPIIQEAKIRTLEASIFYWMGQTYLQQKQYARGLEFFQQALPISRELKDKSQEANILVLMGSAYSLQEKSDQALTYLQQALPIVREVNNNAQEASILALIGDIYFNQKQYEQAIQFYQQALPFTQKTKNKSREAQLIALIGDAYYQRIQYDRALDFYQQALLIAREAKDKFREAKVIAAIGNVYLYQGQSKQAIAFYQQALSIMQEIQDKSSQAELLIILGNTYRIQGDYSKSKDLLEQGLKVAQEEKNPLLQSAGLKAIAYFYNSQYQYQKALELAQQSLKIAQELNLPIYDSKYTLATIYFSLGDYNKSREIYQQLLAIAKQQKNRWYEGNFLLDMAYTYFVQGEPEKTVEFAQQALAIAQELQDPFLATWANINLSIGYGYLGNDQKAMETAKTFLAFTRKVQNPVWEKIALRVIGGLHYRFGRKEESIQAFQQALAIQVPEKDAEILAGLARTYRDLNQPNVAITYYKQSINGIEDVRRNLQGLPTQLQNSFLQATVDFDKVKTADIYRQLADLLLSQGRVQEAQQVLELLKIQEIRDVARGGNTTTDKPNIPLTPSEAKIPAASESLIALGRQISECDRTNCSQKSALNDKLTTLVEQFNQDLQKIETEILTNRSTDDVFFDPRKLAKAREIVNAQPGTVLIYPLVLENKLWLLMYSEGDVVKKFEVNVGQQELGDTVLEFRKLLENRGSNINQVKKTSKQLYDWLVKPIEGELKANSIKHLVFSLDRVTRYIPMSALFDGEKYLIENYTIYNVLSADLTNLSDKLAVGTKNNPVLAMGLSDAISGYNALPNVPAELDAIVQKNATDKQGIYPGNEFLNGAFDFRTLRDNLTGHKILHLATHGVFVRGSSDKSFILLGTGEQLTIPKISTLTGLSNIHLVVLSACETALAGPRQDGIEIASVAYYFLNGGAKAVIASLWLVNDASTSLMMQQFYKNLATGTSEKPMTKSEALRQTQLSLLQGKITAKDAPQRGGLGVLATPGVESTVNNSSSSNFSHPYYWAPFILIGNGL